MPVTCSLPYPDSAIPKGGAFGDSAPPRTREHRGVDWSLFHVRRLGLDPWWTFVTDGTITLLSATDKGELGFILEVRDDEGWFWTYAHSAEFVAGLRVGGRVARGQRGGRMGSTGSVVQPGSEHLHLALSRASGGGIGGTVYDPLAHIKARLTTTAGGGAAPLPTDDPEDDDMGKNSGFQYTRSTDKAIVYLIANTDSGFASEYTDGRAGTAIPTTYNNAVAAAFGTASYAPISEGHAKAIKRDCGAVLASRGVTVDVDSAPITVQAETDPDVVRLLQSIDGRIDTLPEALIDEQKKPGN